MILLMILGVVIVICITLLILYHLAHPVNKNIYVDELFIKAYFTLCNINRVCIERLQCMDNRYKHANYLVFYGDDNKRFVCYAYTYETLLSANIANAVATDIRYILSNYNLQITYAADPSNGMLYMRPE